MKYISLDVETTGLDPKQDQILQIAMVVEDTNEPDVSVEELPYFNCYITHERYSGDAFALQLNNRILRILARVDKADAPIYGGKFGGPPYTEEWVRYAIEFVRNHYPQAPKPILAGKNVASFDYQFLPEQLKRCFDYRFIDPGSIFLDFKTAQKVPSLEDIKKALGFADPKCSHNALDDARDVIRVLRRK